MSIENRSPFSQSVSEGIGLGVGIRFGAGIADMAGALIKAIGVGNILAIVIALVAGPIAVIGVGAVLVVAISPFVLLVCLLALGKPNDFTDMLIIPAIVGVISYGAFGCLWFYGFIFRKERATARARKLELESRALKPTRRRRGSAPKVEPEPNHGWGQALLAIGTILLPAWLVLVLVPKFPRRHRITAAVLLLISLALGLALFFSGAGIENP